MMSGLEYIQEERKRQVLEKGYGSEHDRECHTDFELTQTAIVYAATAGRVPLLGDYQMVCDSPSGEEAQVELLAKAGALIAAEIDRLLAEAVG